jgi:hypothetical protein
MDNSEIDHKALAGRIAGELRSLPAHRLHLVLLQYCLELTILARMDFVDGTPIAAQECNEALHRILGFLNAEFGSATCGQKDFMIGMIVTSAEQKKRLLLLQRSLEVVNESGGPG